MPLPKQALGPDAAGLSLASNSGVDSNADAARNAGRGVTAADLARQGRLTGYTLDYMDPGAKALRVGHGLLEVQTIAERYRSGATAAKGLAFWRRVTRALAGAQPNGIAVRLSPFAVRVGDGAYAYELVYTVRGKPRLYVGDVVFRSGALLGAVFVTAADEAGLRARTARLAGALRTRMAHVLAGRVR